MPFSLLRQTCGLKHDQNLLARAVVAVDQSATLAGDQRRRRRTRRQGAKNDRGRRPGRRALQQLSPACTFGWRRRWRVRRAPARPSFGRGGVRRSVGGGSGRPPGAGRAVAVVSEVDGAGRC